MGERVHCDSRCRVRDESGQVLVLVTVVMVVMIAMAGFALDVGHAYLVQRQLQAATDAAALSAALDLPNTTASLATVTNYGPEPGKKNRLGSNDNARFDVQFKCVTAIVTGCTPTSGLNSISVRSTSVVSTVFAKVIGIDSFTVHANATACSPCSVKPLDIMIVLDRTGSMCQITNPAYNPVTNPGVPKVITDPMVNKINPATGKPYGNPAGCTDLTNAKNGISTFLAKMNPPFHQVGLTVFPPVARASTESDRCAAPIAYSNTAVYTLVGLSSDYATAPGSLNAGSALIRTLGCLPSASNTSYASAINSAQSRLAAGRSGVQKVIIFLSDGAANTGSTNPCADGITASRNAHLAGTTVYSIGYDLDGGDKAYEQCTDSSPITTSFQAMQAIASSPDTFYNKPDPGQLNTIFSSIADDIFRTAQLIDDSLS